MREVYDGTVYDTEAAEEVASASAGASGDFDTYSETLYRGPNGSWFLAGTGGPKTKYAEPVPTGGLSGGSRIFPQTEDKAFDWLQRNQELQVLQEHFSDRLQEA